MTPIASSRAGQTPRRTLPETAQGIAGALVLAAVVAGVPAGLVALARALQPVAGWDPSRIASLLTRPDDGTLLILALLLVGWTAWSVFALSVLLEVISVARGMPTPRLPLLSLPQHGAAVLVAAASLLLAPAGNAASITPRAHAVPLPAQPASQPLRIEDAPAEPRREAETATHHSAPAVRSPSAPTVTVQRHDTLWSLAERHLGSGHRFSEIVALNLGRPQPDGRALTEAHWIYPGWTLRLPPDAQVPPPPPSNPAPAAGDSHTVEPGNTLWQIAEDHLGDGHRYPEIYALNSGGEQPDGRQLDDPDEIHPGWQLRLPTTISSPEETTEAAGPDQLAPPPEDDPASPAPGPTPPIVERRSTTPAAPTATEGETPAIADGIGDEDTPSAPALMLGLGSIVLAGLVAELARRRRLQQRARRTGHRIPMPGPAGATAERQARQGADPVTARTVQKALRALSRSCRADGRPLPDVVLLTVAAASVQLVLAQEDGDAVPPFHALDSHTWRLESTPSALPSDDDDDEPDPYPALVTLGVADDALVLVNLEAVGSLEIAGPPELTAPVLRAVAVDLVVGPLAQGSAVTFVDCFRDLAEAADPGRADVAADPSAATVAASAQLTAVRQILESAGLPDLRHARAQGFASDAATPQVILARCTLPITVSPWSGVAAVAAVQAATGTSTWRLTLRAEGAAALDPLGMELHPQHWGSPALTDT